MLLFNWTLWLSSIKLETIRPTKKHNVRVAWFHSHRNVLYRLSICHTLVFALNFALLLSVVTEIRLSNILRRREVVDAWHLKTFISLNRFKMWVSPITYFRQSSVKNHLKELENSKLLDWKWTLASNGSSLCSRNMEVLTTPFLLSTCLHISCLSVCMSHCIYTKSLSSAVPIF